MLERMQFLEEPPWDTLHVTDPTDVPGIKFNYTWLTNLAKFELGDRMHELQLSLPGRLSGVVAWSQAAFGLEYAASVEALRSLFLEHGGDVRLFFKKNSLLWLARRFSWSPTPDQDHSIDGLRFSKFVLHSTELVAWIALLLGIIRLANRDQTGIIEFRELYSKIVLLSLFR